MERPARPRGYFKASPDDFIVRERIRAQSGAVSVVPVHHETWLRGHNSRSSHAIMHMTKRGVSAQDAIRQVASGLGVSPQDVTSYGIKDRHAVTSQVIAVRGPFEPTFAHPDIILRQQNYVVYDGLTPGHNVGNNFRIRVKSDAEELDLDALTSVPNHFGPQRFSTPESPITGQLLLEGKVQEAAKHLRNDGNRTIARLKEETGSWADAIYHPELRFDVKMRVAAWQSHLWNKLRNTFRDEDVPETLPVWWDNDRVRGIYAPWWNPGAINKRALETFAVPFERSTSISPGNMKVDREDDAWIFDFDLPSGAYATVVLGQVFDLCERRH